MRANRSFIAHRGSETRRFKPGEVVPQDWWDRINKQELVDKPLPHLQTEDGSGPALDPFPGYHGLKTVDDVVGWVHTPEDWDEKRSRARYALDRELGSGKPRSSLVGALNDLAG